jgi:hypothetical protein
MRSQFKSNSPFPSKKRRFKPTLKIEKHSHEHNQNPETPTFNNRLINKRMSYDMPESNKKPSSFFGKHINSSSRLETNSILF